MVERSVYVEVVPTHIRHLVGHSLQEIVELSPQQQLHAASSLQRGQGMLAQEEIIICTLLSREQRSGHYTPIHQ